MGGSSACFGGDELNQMKVKGSAVISHGEDGVLASSRFRGGLVFKAHRLLYHSTLGLRVIEKEEEGTISNGVPRGMVSGPEALCLHTVRV